MLKVDFHTHTNYIQGYEGHHSPKELIDRAKELGFDVLCITEHGSFSWYGYKEYFDYIKTYNDFKDYAKSRGVLLISGVEIEIGGKEVLLINFKGDVKKLNKFSDLDGLGKDVLVIAPHAFYYFRNCLKKKLVENISRFDAVEYNHFYCRFFNVPNWRAVRVAEKFGKVLVGSSDAHRLYQFGKTYSLVDSSKDVKSIVKAVKSGKVKVVSKPLSLFVFVKIAFIVVVKSKMRKLLYKVGILHR